MRDLNIRYLSGLIIPISMGIIGLALLAGAISTDIALVAVIILAVASAISLGRQASRDL